MIYLYRTLSVFFLLVVLQSSKIYSQSFSIEKPEKKEKEKEVSEIAEYKEAKTLPYLQIRGWSYREPGVMSDKGTLFGIGFLHKFPDWEAGFLELNVSYVRGETEYDGSLVNLRTRVKTPISTVSNNSILTLDGSFYFRMKDGPFHNFGIGVFFRRLVNEDEPSLSFDYEREQSYFTVPVLWKSELFFGKSFSLEILAKLHFIFFGRNSSHFEDVVENAPTLEFSQESGMGASLLVNFKVKNFVLGLGYNYWNVDTSSSETISDDSASLTFVEPENNTNTVFTNLGYQF